MIIWISGPTGSGKTTLSNYLQQSGWRVIREIIPLEVFEKFASDPQNHCAQLQENIIQSRFDQFSRLKSEKIAFDRSVSEDVEVFCRLHMQNGYLSEEKFRAIKSFGDSLLGKMPNPDLVIYLSSSFETLRDRLHAAGQPEIVSNSLRGQISLYESWLNAAKYEVLQIDNSRCGPDTLKTAVAGN